MTVLTDVARVQYTANGVTTIFNFGGRVLDATHLDVYCDGVLQSTGYTVNNVGSATSDVEFAVAPANAMIVTIARDIPFTQTADYVEGDDFPAETHERALDKLTMIALQQKDGVDRALKFPNTDATTLVATLPDAATRASKVLSFDVDGNPDVTNTDANSAIIAQQAAADAVAAKNAAQAAVGAVKVSSNDTTAGDLEAKLLVGTGLALTTQNDGANETRTINHSFASQAEAEAGAINTKPMSPLRVAQAIAALSAGTIDNKGYIASRYYFGAHAYPSGSPIVCVANRHYFVLFVVGSAVTMTKIGINVTTLHASNARLGIYNIANGAPSSLILDAGTVSVGSTGEKEATISQLLPAGIYAASVVFSGTPSVSAASMEPGYGLHMFGGATSAPTDAIGGYNALTYGVLPANFGSVTYAGGGNMPTIWMRS